MDKIGIRTIVVNFDDEQLPYLSLVQGDAKTRGFDIVICDSDGKEIPPIDDYIVELVATGSNAPDTPYANRHTVKDGKYRVMIPTEALSESGFVFLQLVFYQKSTGAVIHTIEQKCPVYRSRGQEVVDSNNLYVDITALRLGLERIDELDNRYESMLGEEKIRQDAEEQRIADETIRQSNETTRKSQETARQSAEDKRVSAETIRDNNEAIRNSNEEKRGQLKTELADTTTKVQENKFNMNRELISRRNRKPMITIVDDDGRTNFLTNWEPILREKEFKISIAVITDFVGNPNYMTWEQLEQLKKNYNVDLVNHTHTHKSLTEITEAELQSELENSKRILQERGHSYDVLVYPYGSNDATVRRVTREYCRTGLNISGGVNTPPLETFRLNRLGLLPPEGSMETIEYYKGIIDEAVAKNGWIIWMSHSQYPTFDTEKVKAIIDYANNVGIEWVHVGEGLDKIGNIMDIGDYTARLQGVEFTVIDADGVLHSRTNSVDYHIEGGNFATVNTPISNFPAGKATITLITSDSNPGFPENKSGILETFRFKYDTYSYQIFKIHNTNAIYKRRWDNASSKWATFERIDGTRLLNRISKKVTTAIPAKTAVNVSLRIDEIALTNDHNVFGSPSAGLEAGLVYNVYVNYNGNLVVRLYNSTDVEINTDRTWKFDITRS